MRNRPTFRPGASLRWLTVCGLAVLGFAASHALVGGSVAAVQGSTTIPTPDPPPPRSTTIPTPDPRPSRRKPTPPPPAPPTKPKPVTTPPAPAPPPEFQPAPSPPPPAARPSHRSVVHAPVHRPKRAKPREIRPVKHLARPRPSSSPDFQPVSLHSQSAAAVGAAAQGGGSSSSHALMAVIAAVALAFGLLAVGAASAPARLMPGFALPLVASRRSDLVVAGVGLTLSVCVGLLVVIALK